MANKKVRVAIIGVGNCASSLVQGVQFYKNAQKDETIPGIMHTQLGDYHVRDIEFTLAIDVNATKVGKDLSEAIFAEPNNTYKFADVPHLGVPVVRGMTHDGLGKYLSEVITKAPGSTADIVKLLQAKPRPMWSSTSCPSALRWQPNGTWNRSSKPAVHSSMAFPFSSLHPNIGASALKMQVCPSSAMTSRVKSGRRSFIVC
jgi:hypothetical protein